MKPGAYGEVAVADVQFPIELRVQLASVFEDVSVICSESLQSSLAQQLYPVTVMPIRTRKHGKS